MYVMASTSFVDGFFPCYSELVSLSYHLILGPSSIPNNRRVFSLDSFVLVNTFVDGHLRYGFRSGVSPKRKMADSTKEQRLNDGRSERCLPS